MFLKKLFIVFLCALLFKSGFGQTSSNNFLSLNAGAGILVYYGNIGQTNNLSSFSRMNTGLNLALEQRFSKLFSVAATGLYGKLAESNNLPTDHRNFQSSIYQGDLSLMLRTEKLFPKSSVTPFLGVGIGYVAFDPYGDLHAANGEKYYYWSNGSIMNMPQGSPNAMPLQRSYNYNTKLDSLNKYPHSSIVIPFTFGFNMRLTDNFCASIGASYYMAFTNAIDNVNKGKNDSYLYASFSLTYEFRKKEEEKSQEDKRYSRVNFTSIENGDSDGDGVKDSKDKCPGTPKGVKVDSDGCPLDSDGDGIPDYLDKEPNSKKGAIVDANGITQTDEMLAKKQTEWDAGATERSDLFNANPTQTTIEQIEKKSLENKKETGKSKSLPVEFQSADFNKDGFISVSEINQVIDGFFSGENDFTVEKINRLVDFFFEQ